MEMKKSSRMRKILCILLVICYLVGMFCMIFGATPIGIILWVLFLAGGLAMLYQVRLEKKKVEEAERLRKAAEGESEESCE